MHVTPRSHRLFFVRIAMNTKHEKEREERERENSPSPSLSETETRRGLIRPGYFFSFVMKYSTYFARLGPERPRQ